MLSGGTTWSCWYSALPSSREGNFIRFNQTPQAHLVGSSNCNSIYGTSETREATGAKTQMFLCFFSLQKKTGKTSPNTRINIKTLSFTHTKGDIKGSERDKIYLKKKCPGELTRKILSCGPRVWLWESKYSNDTSATLNDPFPPSS